MKKVIGRKVEWLVNNNSFIKVIRDPSVELIEVNGFVNYFYAEKNGSLSDSFSSRFAGCSVNGGYEYGSNFGILVVFDKGTYRPDTRGFRLEYYTKFVPIEDKSTYFILRGDYYEIDGIGYDVAPNRIPLDYKGSLYLFDNRLAQMIQVKMRDINVVYRDINISLTPIQLTSSIPAYLASDNLPHSAGECGMWDSVSEKFYGNANTSGKFSVENELDEYVEVDLTGIAINGKYQRVTVENSEIPSIVWNGVNARMLMLNGKVVWNDGILIGERYQYLAFKANLTSTDICEIPTIIDWPRYFRLQIKHSWNQQQYVTLWQAGNFRLHKPSSSYALYYPNGSYTGQFSISGQLDFDCIINNEDGTCEGYVGSKQLNIANFGSVSGRLRLMLKSSNWRNTGQVGECILTDLDTNEVKHHFIPCVLSVDIDENLSLLNTPYQQGTIGMWDIVTKKFTTNSKGFDVLEARNKQGFITK